MVPDLSVSKLLPEDARRALIKAALTEPSAAAPLKRQKAIEKAIERIKSQYPQFFHIPKEQ